MLQYSGWHGTTNKRKEEILSTGFSYKKYEPGIDKQRHPNDLGNGIYFFLPFNRDTGKIIASAYVAKYKSSELRKPGITPELINAEITIESEDNIFILDEPKNQSLLDEYRQRAYIEIEREIASISDSGAKNRATLVNQNQGLVIELLLDLASQHGKDFKAVQSKTYTDIPFLPVFDGKNGEEICIRDLNCITNIL
ncbi:MULTISPECIES: hypothetical protein [unclassified Streptococcus]|uniref:hypothetical protein n=1 Tax=unclassified Streptococcus TaxID=2608887 RepID=UPI0019125BDA|nr:MULTISPECIES: hypothetical protein [unclassified Streptococcus]MBK5045338.1 hypothetical protein [Streptococcus sp. 2.1]MBK5160753.1 hypothetical protein [Streptococcus sp. 3.1]MBS5709249.1 hypothetical protein [Veillonella sp.]